MLTMKSREATPAQIRHMFRRCYCGSRKVKFTGPDTNWTCHKGHLFLIVQKIPAPA